MPNLLISAHLDKYSAHIVLRSLPVSVPLAPHWENFPLPCVIQRCFRKGAKTDPWRNKIASSGSVSCLSQLKQKSSSYISLRSILLQSSMASKRQVRFRMQPLYRFDTESGSVGSYSEPFFHQYTRRFASSQFAKGPATALVVRFSPKMSSSKTMSLPSGCS